jgi:hypothetical protein
MLFPQMQWKPLAEMPGFIFLLIPETRFKFDPMHVIIFTCA